MNLVPAKPRNAKERRYIEDATKAGFFMTRDPNGDLNAARNYPPGWDAMSAWQRAHPNQGLALSTAPRTKGVARRYT